MQLSSCSTCKFQLSDLWYFCPNCGKQCKEKVPEISIAKQIVIYLVSFFLAPLGLGWGFKYIRSTSLKVRLIGLTAIVLTIASIGIMMILFRSVADQYARMLKNLSI